MTALVVLHSSYEKMARRNLLHSQKIIRRVISYLLIRSHSDPLAHNFSHTISRTQFLAHNFSHSNFLSTTLYESKYIQPLDTQPFTPSAHLTMSPTFKEFNSNPLKCSVWVKDKDRCCQRKIADVDQKRKASLFQSISVHQVTSGDEAEELAGLYFCNGWHRTGGKYAIPALERRKVLLLLFPNASEPTTRFAPAPQPWQRPSPPSTYAAHDPESPGLSEAERFYFSVAESATQMPGDNVGSQRVPPILASTTGTRTRPVNLASRESPLLQRRTQAEQSPLAEARSQNRGQRYTASPRSVFENSVPNVSFASDNAPPPVSTRQTRQSARVREQEPEIPPQVTIPTPRRSARIRGEEPEISPQAAIPTPRRSARIRGEEPEISPQAAIPTPRQSARIRGQAPEISPQVAIPTPRQSARIRDQAPVASAEGSIPAVVTQPRQSTSTQHRHPGRMNRLVDPNEDCPVCTSALGDHGGVSRCNVCQNDLHKDCLLEWLIMPNSHQSCVCW
jgi:hypothetical protein